MAKKETTVNTKALATEWSLEQQLEAIKEEIQRFTKLFKDKGSIAISEINELLAPEIIASQALDQLMQGLEVAGVILSDASEIKKEEEEDQFMLGDPNASNEEEEESEGEEDTRSNDPVRLYLRKMGSVSLLTREGEVEIARRIEDGEREIVRAILMSPIGTNEIIQLGKRLDEGRIKIKAIFRGLEDEETQYDEQEYIEKIHELIGHVKRYQKKAAEAFGIMKENPPSAVAFKTAERELTEHNQELMANF